TAGDRVFLIPLLPFGLDSAELDVDGLVVLAFDRDAFAHFDLGRSSEVVLQIDDDVVNEREPSAKEPGGLLGEGDVARDLDRLFDAEPEREVGTRRRRMNARREEIAVFAALLFV